MKSLTHRKFLICQMAIFDVFFLFLIFSVRISYENKEGNAGVGVVPWKSRAQVSSQGALSQLAAVEMEVGGGKKPKRCCWLDDLEMKVMVGIYLYIYIRVYK